MHAENQRPPPRKTLYAPPIEGQHRAEVREAIGEHKELGQSQQQVNPDHRRNFILRAPLRQALTLAGAQSIAEGIVGPIRWDGGQGLCTCPGIELHTKGNAATDCKVVVERMDSLAPGIYCFHGSCSAVIESASFQLRSALGKQSLPSQRRVPVILPRSRVIPLFDPARLEKTARKLDGIDAAWFAARSPRRVDDRTAASVLHDLYKQGENVLVFDVFKSQGQALWSHRGFPFNARELNGFRRNKREGVWYLTNPVSGEFADTGTLNSDGSPHLSRRTAATVTSWRYILLESDEANPVHWLAVLAQLPLRISAIYSSGGKSIHALVRLDAASKAEWDGERDEMLPVLIPLGACRKALSAVRLSRLPGCERLGSTDASGVYRPYPTPRLQALLYLNPKPDDAPVRESYAEWLSPETTPEALQSLLRPYPADEMDAYAISKRVNSPRYDDAAIVEPLL